MTHTEAAHQTPRRRRAGRRAAALLLALLVGGVVGAGTADAADGLTLTPSAGPVGSVFTLSGTLTCPDVPTGGNILVRFVDLDEGFQTGTNLGEVVKQADSTFSGEFVVPSELSQLIPGEGIFPVEMQTKDYTVQASCSISTSPSIPTIGATFTVTDVASPTTTAPPTSVTPPSDTFEPPATPPTGADPLTGLSTTQVGAGGTIEVDEGGFEPGESVNIVLYSTPVVLKAGVAADGDGRVVTSVRVPASTPSGAHTLVLYGESTVKAASITVTGSAGAQLPVTGFDSRDGTRSALALALILFGSGMLVAGRRRAERSC